MQRRNLRPTRQPSGSRKKWGKRGELQQLNLSSPTKCVVCDAPLAAGMLVQWRTGCVQHACLTCDFKKDLGNYV